MFVYSSIFKNKTFIEAYSNDTYCFFLADMEWADENADKPSSPKKRSLMLFAAYKQQATLCQICLNYSFISKNETFISTNPN